MNTVKPNRQRFHQQIVESYSAVSTQHENDHIYIQYNTYIKQHATCVNIKFGINTMCTYLGDQRGSLRRSNPLVMKLYKSSNLRWTTLLHHRYTCLPNFTIHTHRTQALHTYIWTSCCRKQSCRGMFLCLFSPNALLSLHHLH